jgi:hypothetical protein
MFLGQFNTGNAARPQRSGFGTLEQIVAPEAVTDDALDELAAFILGSVRLGPLLPGPLRRCFRPVLQALARGGCHRHVLLAINTLAAVGNTIVCRNPTIGVDHG